MFAGESCWEAKALCWLLFSLSIHFDQNFSEVEEILGKIKSSLWWLKALAARSNPRTQPAQPERFSFRSFSRSHKTEKRAEERKLFSEISTSKEFIAAAYEKEEKFSAKTLPLEINKFLLHLLGKGSPRN